MGNQQISNRIAEKTQMDPIPIEDLIAMNIEWKEGHGKNIGILRGVSGIASMISSSTLIWMIARSHKGLSTTQHRMIFGLSMSDLISSLGYSAFNSMTPSDVNYYVWNARGNEASCDVQGFLVLLGVVVGLCYNSMLNVYYVAVVNFLKSEDYIRTKVEPFLHGIPTVVGLAFSITSLVGNHLNDNGFGLPSWPVHDPPHCQGYDVGDVREGFKIPCYRGSKGGDTFLTFLMVGMFIPAVIIIASLIAIYGAAVKKQENKLKKYGANSLNININSSSNSPSLWKRIINSSLSRQSSTSTNGHPAIRSNNVRSRSRAVMQKAFQYSTAWFLSYGMTAIGIYLIDHVAFSYVITIFKPLQGFLNLCIYMYPKVISARRPKRRQEKISWCQAISMAFWSRGKDTKRKRLRPYKSPNLTTIHPVTTATTTHSVIDSPTVKGVRDGTASEANR